MHANFGSLTNRALAQLIGHHLSEQTGQTISVQHDPYRIFVQSLETIDANRVIDLLSKLKHTPELAIQEALTRATVKTGLFKRRIIHVARRFGALKKWADFSSVSLSHLLKSFEDTAIYDEALKEVFTKDLDLKKALGVVEGIRKGEISIVKIDAHRAGTPIARVGIERISMKTDLIPPERMRHILVGSAKARLLDEVRSFVCTRCWDYLEMIRVKDLPEKPTCPLCGSNALGILAREEDHVRALVEKKGEKLSKTERLMEQEAIKTAKYLAKWGRTAAIALSARKVKPESVKAILQKEKTTSDNFFEMLIEAERKALKKRFWVD